MKPARPVQSDRLKVAAMLAVAVLLVGNAYLITMGKVEFDFLKVELFDSSPKPENAILPQVEAYVPPPPTY
jgi:hypothetical protein